MSGSRFLWCGAAAMLLWAGPARAEAVAVNSKLERVTVYRGQALVTRSVALPAEAGELEIVVSELPEQTVGASLAASAAGAAGVTVRSVRYRGQAVATTPNKEVAALDEQIQQLKDDMYVNKQEQALVETRAKFVAQLQGFTAGSAKAEAGQGTLNAKALADTSDYILKQLASISQDTVKLHQAEQKLQQELALLERKRAELTRGAAATAREAVIFLTKAQAGPAGIELSYLVGSANWSPAYNVRLGEDAKAVRIEYLAEVAQMSGEDWTGVAMSLSTATPAMNAESPVLAPLWVGLAALAEGQQPAPAQKMTSKAYAERQRAIVREQWASNAAYLADARQAEQAGWDLNRFAAQGQELELNVDRGVALGAQEALRAAAEGLAVTYALPGTMSLASRSDRQLVQIGSLELPGELHYEAIPLLSSYVFRSAKVTNTGSLPLLSGPYSAYLEGDFVGRGTLPVVARGQEVAIGLGVDTQLRCRRELADKSDKVAWGTRVQQFRYKLLLESFKPSPVAVRLYDRIPASKGEDVRISLEKTSEKLSIDPVYVRDLLDRGILRWDISLPAHAASAQARQVEYSFEMKFAKDKDIGRPTAGLMQEMEQDYRRMFLAK